MISLGIAVVVAREFAEAEDVCVQLPKRRKRRPSA